MFSTTSSSDLVLLDLGERVELFRVLHCFACFKYFLKLNNLFPGKIKTIAKIFFFFRSFISGYTGSIQHEGKKKTP